MDKSGIFSQHPGFFERFVSQLSLEVVASEEELLLEAPDPRYHGSGVFAPSQFAPGGDPKITIFIG
jgi:hypothetical protein